jgi:damage-control phosphatase, subfamily I
MKLHPGCIPCIVGQAYRLSRMSGITDADTQKQVLYDTMENLLHHNNIKTAPHFSVILQSIIGQYTDVHSAIRKTKKANLNTVKIFTNYLSHMIKGAPDPLEMAVRAAIAGNTIDLGANPDFDIEHEINHITSNSIDMKAFNRFREEYERAESILIIADNYEEALFDKLLIQQMLPKNIVYAVRSDEILNDITMDDAYELDIDNLCTVMDSGSTISGTDLEDCHEQFQNEYRGADIVIAKGQGNYETLFNAQRPIYFMFKVKCKVIADICGHPVRTSMLYYHNGNNGQ